MIEKRVLAFSPPDRNKPVNDEAQAPGCSESFTAYDICQFAHHEVTQKGMRPADGPYDPSRVREHLAKGCSHCLRWYRNSRRTYQRLACEGKLAVAAEAEPERPAAVVLGSEWMVLPTIDRPVKHLKLAGEETRGYAISVVKREEEETGLNGLTLNLEFQQTSNTSTGQPGWEFTLLHYTEEIAPGGNDPKLLREFDDCLVMVKVQPVGAEAICLETRLGLDEDGNLVSSPCTLESVSPEQIESIGLLKWKRYGSGQL